MSDDGIIRALHQALSEVAPEADLAALSPDASLRRELDLDSMDFLNFVVRLHELLGVEVAEAEYGRMRSLRQCEALLREKLAQGGGNELRRGPHL